MRSKKIDGLNLKNKYIGQVNYTLAEKNNDFEKHSYSLMPKQQREA